MTVEAIEPHGFCSGVTAAVAKARRALDGCGEVFCVHELVHNETVVGELKAKGLRFVGCMDEVPDGGTVLFSAHGVGPATRRAAEARGLSVVDATCPFVARVHRQVRACAERGLPVVVVGHARHVEVAGVVDEARDAGADVAVAATPEDVDALAIPRGSAVGVVCQTTLSADVVQKVMEALRARYPVLETGAGAGVCTATRDRQDAVRRFVASGSARRRRGGMAGGGRRRSRQARLQGRSPARRDVRRVHPRGRVRGRDGKFPNPRLKPAGECGILFPSCLSKAR